MCLYVVPGDVWKNQNNSTISIFDFFVDALAIERRIKKEVNLNNERRRYQLCCRRIQEAVIQMSSSLEKVTLGENYFDILKFLYEKFPSEVIQTRLMSCFHLPDNISDYNGHTDQLLKPAEVAEHQNSVRRLLQRAGISDNALLIERLNIFQKASDQGAGIVENAGFLVPREDEKSDIFPYQSFSQPDSSAPTEHQPDDQLSHQEHKKLLDILKEKINKAIITGGEINFSNQSHPVIADALNEFVYKEEPGQEETSIRVIYMDGSEAEPFPLRCLNRKEEFKTINPLRASLISMRHLKMDDRVDFAWFRNRKVSSGKAFAETDAFCTERTIELLNRSEEGKKLDLHLYQTGLEPAVVGFFRGLVKQLINFRNKTNAPDIQITPYYFNRNDAEYRPGRVWT